MQRGPRARHKATFCGRRAVALPGGKAVADWWGAYEERRSSRGDARGRLSPRRQPAKILTNLWPRFVIADPFRRANESSWYLSTRPAACICEEPTRAARLIPHLFGRVYFCVVVVELA